MKKVKYTLLLVIATLSIRVYGDIIISQPRTDICVKITNLEDYPDIVIIGVSDYKTVFSVPKVEIIDSCSCVKIRKSHPLTFYAVKKDYLEINRIEKIDWKRDKNLRKGDTTVDSKKITFYSSDVSILELNLFIVGFNENLMVMSQPSLVYKFNNNKPDEVLESPAYETYINSLRESLKLQKSF